MRSVVKFGYITPWMCICSSNILCDQGVFDFLLEFVVLRMSWRWIISPECLSTPISDVTRGHAALMSIWVVFRYFHKGPV